MARITQITGSAQSEPGVFAKGCDVLAGVGANITAVCGAESSGRSRIRMVVSDPERARQALTAAKIWCGEEPGPGALGSAAARLASAETAAARTPAHVVVAAANTDRTEWALR